MCGRSPCGKPDCTWSEAHRALCEARTVAAWNRDARISYYKQVDLKRGRKAATDLVEAVNSVKRDKICGNLRYK